MRYVLKNQEMQTVDHETIHGIGIPGENPAITSKDYLSLSGAKSQGIKQLMAGGGIALVGATLIPLLSGLFS